jgi:FMN reductase (NADPH)
MSDHRSVRSFTDAPVPGQDVRRAVQAAQMAATSSHVQGYSLFQVTDADQWSALVRLTGGQAYVATAGAFFVVCGDLRRHWIVAKTQGKPHQDNLETFLLAVIDTSLFAQNLVLAFESMGYGICYIGGLRNQLPEVDRLLAIPHGVLPLYGLCVGVPASREERRPRLPVDAVFFEGAFPDDETLAGHIAEHDRTMADYYAARGLTGRDWSGGIWRKFARALRDDLADYYTSKGARLS